MRPTFRSSCIARLAGAAVVASAIAFSIPTTTFATICIVPDAAGTAQLPPQTPSASCTDGYLSPTDVHMIIDGLPPGTTIEIGAEHFEFLCPGMATVCSFPPPMPGQCNQPGGGLGGEQECADSNLLMNLQGTGTLLGYNRVMNIPLQFETHTAPRTPGQPVQDFDTDMFRLFGQITNPGAGDPDFDLLRIVAGTDFGLPSPGHTTLTQVPGGWNVDSFFDITYRIDFVGAPGGPMAGMSGSTTGTIRMGIGEPATVIDHMECFKVKDPTKLKGIVDVPTLAGSPYDAIGCQIGNAKRWCTPAQKVVISSSVPVTPQPGPNLTSDYICYKLKCPKVDLTQGVQDQFGARTLGKMKQNELCVPAVKTP